MPRVGLTLFLTALGLAMQPGLAEGGFAPANEEYGRGEQFRAGGIATDAAGDALIVWAQQQEKDSTDQAMARQLTSDGLLSVPVNLAPGERSDEPRVAITPSGNAFVAWRSRSADNGPYGVKGRWVTLSPYLLTPVLGPVLTLAVGGEPTLNAGEVMTAVDPAGVATVAWKNTVANNLELRRVRPDGTLGPTTPDFSGSGVNEPQIAALPGGGTLAVWRGDGIEANVVGPALDFGAPSMISATNAADGFGMAFDSAGNGLVAWREFHPMEQLSVEGRILGPGGQPAGGLITIDPAGDTYVDGQIRVAADSHGDFVAAWQRQDAGGSDLLHARGLNSAGVFTGPDQLLSLGYKGAFTHEVAIDDVGGGAMVWDDNVNSDLTTLGRTINPLGAPTGPIQELLGDGKGENLVASTPALGYAAFLVSYSISGSASVGLVRRYLEPPRCADSTATVLQGRAVGIPLECAGPVAENAQVTAKPMHGKATSSPRTFVGKVPVVNPAMLAYEANGRFAGTDRFTYVASNDGGTSGAATVSIRVRKDKRRPRITRFRFVRARKAGRGASAARRPKRADRFVLGFSERAKARVTVERGVKRLRGGIRFRPIGRAVSRSRRASPTTHQALYLSGGLKRKLAKGGRFRATAVATDVAGNRSKPRRLKFRLAELPK